MRKYHFTEITYETILRLREEGDEDRLCRLAETCIKAEYRRLNMDMESIKHHMDRSCFKIEQNFQYVKRYIEERDARYKRHRISILSMV